MDTYIRDDTWLIGTLNTRSIKYRVSKELKNETFKEETRINEVP